MRRTPALIVGGGPAGAAAATVLARAGAKHLLLERQAQTGDALCGGFLSWRTLATLEQLDIAADRLNPADVTRLRLFAGRATSERPLPRAAKAVSRHRLDTLLLANAEAAGARVERGVMVRAIEGLTVRLADRATLTADALLLASGKHDVRGLPRPATARGDDPTLGLRLRLAPSQTLTRLVGDAIELHLFDRGYAGLVLQEDGSANLCMAVHRSRLSDAGSPAALLDRLAADHPHLAERLAGRDTTFPIEAVANVPYGWRALATSPGLFRLGDQAGVIPSLAGEGMGIALASGVRAAHALLADGARGAPDYQRRLARELARPIGVASAVWRLAERPAGARTLVAASRLLPFAADTLARLTRVRHTAVDGPGAG